jgi:outer membrane protein OmpA-like peptidoglycan-associated protein
VLYADKFEFKHAVGDKFRIVSTTKESVALNGKVVQNTNIINRMASEVTALANGRATLNAVFNVAEEAAEEPAAGKTSPRLRWGEEYKSVFTRDRLGKITIDKRYFMPSARDVPYFPDREVNAGESWISRGNEVFDLRRTFEIEEPVSVPFQANNMYVGEREWRNKKKYKVLNVNYNMIKNIEGFENAPRTYLNRSSTTAAKPGEKPEIRRINGKSRQILYWDDALGQIAAAEDEFELNFMLTNGETWTFRGTTVSEIIEAEAMNKADLARDIQQTIAELGLTDVSVKVVNEGISISLDNIQFAADSAQLLPGEMPKLEKIAAILRAYKDRDIVVAGHTAAAGASENARIKLSEDRAAEVASYLIKEKVRAPERVITRGYGSSRPVAGNATEEGRRRNRRVEITIMEN